MTGTLTPDGLKDVTWESEEPQKRLEEVAVIRRAAITAINDLYVEINRVAAST